MAALVLSLALNEDRCWRLRDVTQRTVQLWVIGRAAVCQLLREPKHRNLYPEQAPYTGHKCTSSLKEILSQEGCAFLATSGASTHGVGGLIQLPNYQDYNTAFNLPL